MPSKPRPLGFLVILALTMALVLTPGFSSPARAASEDVAMFYEDLSQYGQWAEYDKYGPVWRPSQVPEDWRPYTNGRWAPTDNGYVFETEEPWAWATYHYGNWMPTESGWVWVPGRTWYPSTVEWRTSPESEPVDNSYIGWAPIPPPDYVPPPSYAAPSYYSGSPVIDALTAPLWIFAKAASFLLGFGQPYEPSYSYMSSGVLVPPAYMPVFFSRTVYVPGYVTPAYYPPAFYGGRRHGFAAYNWGPPVGYVSRVTNVNQAVINRTINDNSVHINRMRNVVAPPAVLNRHGYVRQIMPPALAQGHRLPPPQPVQNVRLAQANLNKPHMLPPPQNVPRLQAQIPRVQPAAMSPDRGIPGTALPARATMPLTPRMTQQIQQLPAQQRLVPAPAQPFRPVAATQPAPGQVPPGTPTRPGLPPSGVSAQPGQPQPGQVQPGAGPTPGEFRPGSPRPGTTPGATPAARAPLTPEQPRQQVQEHQRPQRGGTPGQPQPQGPTQERLRQEQLRQQQMQGQQERQRQLQQQQQQERSRQQQMQQDRQRQTQQQQERIRQQQMQQERQRQMQQQQHQERMRQQQVQQQQRQQQERNRQQQMQQERQRQAQQQQQQQQQRVRQQQIQQQQQQRQQQVQPQPRQQERPQRRKPQDQQ
jgi:hypothetical protein